MSLTISELAQAGGVGVETVRFYQRKGLLHDPRPGSLHAGTGRRHYGAQDVRRLRFIRAAKAAGFILDEIAQLLELDASDDRARARAMAETRLVQLEAEIAQLEAARASLRRLAAECAHGAAGPCPIISAFDHDEVVPVNGARQGQSRE